MSLVSTSAKSSGGGSGGGAWTQICDLRLSSAQSSIDTQTILGGVLPTTYNHLSFVLNGASSVLGSQDQPFLRFNGDSGANYDAQELNGVGATASAVEHLGQVLALFGYIPGASGVANGSGTIQVWIPSYNETTLRKTFVSSDGMVKGTATGTLLSAQFGGGWRSTAAISRITLGLNSGPNFVAGTHFTLWGVT